MMLRLIRNHPVKLLALTAATLAGVACSDTTTTSNSQPEATSSSKPYDAAQFDATAKPKFTTEGGARPFRTANTIPYFSSSFVDPTNGVTYPYTMVGTNPFTGGNVRTTVPSSLIPFRFVFADGTVMDGSQDVAATLASPIFSNFTYPVELSGRGEVTQYGNAIYRAQWNKVRTNYNVLLGAPTLYPTQTIEVPANQGFAFVNSRGVLIGLMDYYWFSSRLKNAINNLGVSPKNIPIILTHNTMLYIGNANNCCIIGYHGAGSSVNGNGAQQVQTYMYGSYITPRTFSGWPAGGDPVQGAGLGDIHALSHEVSEWYDDPFINNLVQPWEDLEFAPQYGCTSYLETGDPVVGIWFPLAGNPQPGANGKYHPEDEVHFSFFARQTPSIAYGGRYTYMGTFTHAAHNCS
jgi:hypothetical protein